MKLLLWVSACLVALQLAPVERSVAVSTLREDLELDRPRDALARGRSWTAHDGPFAHDGEVLALYARALLSAGEDARARALIETATPDDATKAWIAIEAARQALERDELDAAVRALAGAPGKDGSAAPPVRFPELAECWLVRARALARSGNVVEAAPLFQRFLELAPLSPDGPSACHQLAQAALARGNAEDARTWFTRAEELGTWHGFYRARRIQVREHPDDPLPRLGVAQLLLEAREYARAEALLTELTSAKPSFANGWFHLGEARRKQRNFAGASTAYTRALEVDPALAFARFNRAVIARMENRDGEARADFERIVAGPFGEDARLLNAHLELARVLARSGDGAGAAARHRRYVELGGKEPLADKPR